MNLKSPVKSARNIPPTTRMILFVQAGGRCEFNGCNKYLLEHELTTQKCIIAEAAHIVAFSEQGPRGDIDSRPKDIHDVQNLMLLCHDCHELIDKNPDQYSMAILKGYKDAHEDRIRLVTGQGPDQKNHHHAIESQYW